MNNEQDILLLENILMELKLYEMFKQLSFYDLKKRGGPRFRILADKIKNGTPFSLSNGESTPLQFINPEYSSAFESADETAIKKLATGNINMFPFFKDDSGQEYSISDLLKDKTFGGKGEGSGTKVEDYNLQILSDEIEKAKANNGGKPINVIIADKLYKNINGAVTQKGMPKADFNLIDTEGTPVAFLSHKKAGGKGPSADDFIRWSGFTQYADHPEVKAFNEALVKFLQENNLDGLPNQTRFVAPIKDKELIKKLIYGPEYGGKNSPENVNIILQGRISLKPKGKNTYELTSEHDIIPPSIPTGEYQPYFTSSYRGDRNMFGIKNNESIVMTKAVANRASNVYELKNNEFVKIR
jgi:hypothetical protein